MKFVVTNAVISNSGDAAILSGLHQALKSTGRVDRFIVFDSDANATAPLYPDWDVRQQITVLSKQAVSGKNKWAIRLHKQALEVLAATPVLARAVAALAPFVPGRTASALSAMADADVVLSTGGTYFVDHYDFDRKVLDLRLAHAVGTPVVLWTQSMGPFLDDRRRRSIKQLRTVVSAIFFRDDRSQQNWNRVTWRPSKQAVVADAAFALQPALRTHEEDLKDAPPLAIFCVRDWFHAGAGGGKVDKNIYVRAVRSLAARLIDRGWRVSAVSTCQGLPEYATDDSLFADEAFRGLAVNVDHAHRTPEELQRLLVGASLVVTMRMHLAILALMQQVPTVAIAYEFKTLELFRSLGLNELTVDLEDVSEEWAERIGIYVANNSIATLSDSALESLKTSAVGPAVWVRTAGLSIQANA